jgi:hypothetical protein
VTATAICTATRRVVAAGRTASNTFIGARSELSRLKNATLMPAKNGNTIATPTNVSPAVHLRLIGERKQ